ncbi:metal ABC transporter substrate-binding protein [Spiractinospora alimapuensis]|uniref:MetQ/NlpA family ABC transporter substrate-binding protein n=1 Tax=Spiractinospora alimapuensis TaxID=2820884 RepID=UPI001F43CEF6|nr:MetQ/NlpA family ABC transporter substrate-binding protein [Spiractinospora alimapuensis]QVQ54672.1 metal ABC transporter substrate-binding protein [Spiractinospora alimapuensis]
MGLSACSSPSERADDGGADGDLTTLRVGATPVPQADILNFVQDNLAEDAGLNLDIVEYTDYNQPNAALVEGELDVNYYQHRPFLEEYLEGNDDADLTYVEDIHVEAFGLYSEGLEDLDDIEDGAEIGVPNDASNLGRALLLLEEKELITLDDDAGELATQNDIADNPRDLEIVPLEAPQLPRSLQDMDAAVVNGNFAIETDLAETANVLGFEDTEDNPYANGLVVNSGDADDPDIATLNDLLHSAEVRDYMEETWDGVVIPVQD